MVLIMSNTGDVNLDHLVKVVSAGFLHCKFLLCKFIYIFWGDTLRLQISYFSLNFYLLVFIPIVDFPEIIITVVF